MADDHELLAVLNRRFDELSEAIEESRTENRQRFEGIDQRFDQNEARAERFEEQTSRRFDRIEERAERFEGQTTERFDRLDGEVRHAHVRIESLEGSVRQVAESVTTLDEKVDRHKADARSPVRRRALPDPRLLPAARPPSRRSRRTTRIARRLIGSGRRTVQRDRQARERPAGSLVHRGRNTLAFGRRRIHPSGVALPAADLRVCLGRAPCWGGASAPSIRDRLSATVYSVASFQQLHPPLEVGIAPGWEEGGVAGDRPDDLDEVGLGNLLSLCPFE